MNISPQYLAGVIDSDGSICITKRGLKDRPNPNYSVMIQIGWVYKDTTEAFMKQMKIDFGGSYSIVKPSKNSFSKRNHIKYCAYGTTADKILEKIKPFLILKGQQADNAIELRNIVKSHKGAYRPKKNSEAMDLLWKNNAIINDKNGIEE